MTRLSSHSALNVLRGSVLQKSASSTLSVSMRTPRIGTPLLWASLTNPASYANPDIAVLTLDRAINVQPIELPADGAADRLPNGTTLTTVGYGFTRDYCDTDLGHCQVAYDPVRRFANETLISVSQWFVTVDQNPNANGTGGICRGDSGGPHLLARTNTALAVTTAVLSKWCWSTSRDTRLDTPTALSFLRSFLPAQDRQ
jgi:hypothetical protein